MDGSICLLISLLVLAGLIVALVKYLRKPSYHGQGYDKLMGRKGFVIRASQFDGDMRVEVRGETWLARGEGRHGFDTGEKIVVKSIDLDKKVLIVERIDV
ncbi:MAG: NfeD family protein [Candidatus Sabulitectum sp.]|nr:NfeD family protein [Candidatus Sabulitectum sp.]